MKLMPKEFRVYAKCLTYYGYTYEAETKEEATALAEKKLEADFHDYEEISSDDVEIYDTVEVT